MPFRLTVEEIFYRESFCGQMNPSISLCRTLRVPLNSRGGLYRSRGDQSCHRAVCRREFWNGSGRRRDLSVPNAGLCRVSEDMRVAVEQLRDAMITEGRLTLQGETVIRGAGNSCSN